MYLGFLLYCHHVLPIPNLHLPCSLFLFKCVPLLAKMPCSVGTPHAGVPTHRYVPTDDHTGQLEPNLPVDGNLGSCWTSGGAEAVSALASRTPTTQHCLAAAMPSLPSPSQSLPVCKPLGCYWELGRGVRFPLAVKYRPLLGCVSARAPS